VLLDVHHDRLPALAAPLVARVFQGRAARVHSRGDGLRYRLRDGSYREELRDQAELERVVRQLVGKPVCLLHPDSSEQNHRGVIADGATADIIGRIVAARLVDGYAVVDIAVTASHGIDAVERGIRELSLTYRCDLDDAGYQRNTEVDHLAVLPRGRCGAGCAVRADCDGAEDCGCEINTDGNLSARERRSLDDSFAVPENEGLPIHDQEHPAGVQGCACKGLAKSLDVGQSAIHMPTASDTDKDKAPMDELQRKLAEAQAEANAQKVRADQAEAARDAARLEALENRSEAKTAETERTRADQAEQGLKVANEQIKTLTAQFETQKTRADEAERLRADEAASVDARIDAAVDVKVALIAEAAPIIGKNEKGEAVDLSKMSDRAIKCAVVLRVDGVDLETLDPKPSADFVSGAYAGAVKRHARVASSRAAVEKDVAVMIDSSKVESKGDEVTGSEAEKRGTDKIRNSLSSAWKKPAQKDKE